ncbi:YbhB/YbcL family Raf kinase inhibitor-like protein [Pleomorphomonas diazotrophica]|uniref:YbhB/YbcL family Raf kinase inhibitor-like protein n=1 Tax=Pleomorphomonas diazotrophica TaxID=1166257 RepID=A0A1I4W488_9HYPH|nr:YbhB/YbcL family Raf kinase inhibitor-like protein [Pleomorphomonas diazotrophica]PKR87857.1 YbhB/YbcL family Raf kinase inhibitor-like protein [Pleomorphomonas diazotrophica]SFN08341.1 hypothetical protein SAMN05192571_11510 [Pleomorphomonas diazotrophica]
MKALYCVSVAALALWVLPLAAAEPLKVEIGGLDDGRLPDKAAFCAPENVSPKNVSPEVTWSPGPEGTRAYALVMTDPDVPQDLTLINKPGTVIPEDAPRMTIHHWVLADIPAAVTTLPAGAESEGVVPHGKPIGPTPHGLRGANAFTGFFTGNADMAGTYGGYDGPCPPLNDARPHRYTISVYALDTPTLGLTGAFDGPALEAAIKDHVLAEGAAVATYTLNPALRGAAAP